MLLKHPVGHRGKNWLLRQQFLLLLRYFKLSKIRFFRLEMFHQPSNTSFTAENLLSL